MEQNWRAGGVVRPPLPPLVTGLRCHHVKTVAESEIRVVAGCMSVSAGSNVSCFMTMLQVSTRHGLMYNAMGQQDVSTNVIERPPAPTYHSI